MTLLYLERIRDAGRLVSDNSYPGSLGLDQAVYSYGTTGKVHSAAVIASMKFAEELVAQDKVFRFTEVRAEFEEFLVRHKNFINQLGHSKGSGLRPLESLLTMHRIVLDCMLDGIQSDDEIVAKLLDNPRLQSLKLDTPLSLDERPARKRFSKAVEAAAVVRTLLETRERCTECGARMPPSARSKDHIKPVRDGGMGTLDNLKFTHTYCNTGYRTSKEARAMKEAGGGSE